MSNSVLEMNLTRLLYCTECLAAQKKLGTNYKYYVGTLETFLNKLTLSNHRPSPESIRTYEIRIKKLKQTYDTIQNSNVESLLHHHLSSNEVITTSTVNAISPVQNNDNSDTVKASETKSVSYGDDATCCETDNQSLIQGTYTDRCDLFAKERQRLNRELREQLLGGNKSNDKVLSTNEGKNLTHPAGLLRKQEVQREQLAAEMLLLTTDLKNQSSAMSRRIRSDCETVDASIGQVERNTSNLHGVLNELSMELGSKCGRVVWILFFISLGLFLYMILFMKMFRKRIIQSNSAYSSSKTEL
ncbi:Vesicle transport protein [Schistosoma japonicum]|uniref:Vesicle transport protein USE1 n=1 Tax=Schistosoma japonicum TaxID=6182 RepID=A0A4Z2DCW8_SCHJA|nr:Vesicle transport protein [Schistosoma japonicum]TNN14351.1 Vesicle transport protein [Schistosoma japonicum]